VGTALFDIGSQAVIYILAAKNNCCDPGARTGQPELVVEQLPRQIVLAELPSGNFRSTSIFKLFPITGVKPACGRMHYEAL